jgi:hypothetical protein
MSEHKVKPKNKLQKRNHTNPNGILKRKNIFQLVESINKKLPLANEKIKDLLAFSENLISFLQEKHSKELSKLSFNPELDNVQILTAKLINLAIDLNYTIVFDDEYGSNRIRILYPIKRHEFLLYLLEFCWIDDIKSEELKIGYTHLLDILSQHAYLNVLEHDYQEPEDNCFDSEFQWQCEEDMYYDDKGILDEGQLQEASKIVQENLQRLRCLKEKFLEYKFKPFSIFLDYSPTNEHEIAFKEFLLKGLKLDYGIMNKFMPDNNVYEDGGVGFDQSLLLFFDCSEGVEAQWMENFNENSNNGWADPMGWYSVSNGKVKNMTSEEDINEMYENFQYIIDLYEKHLNKMKQWNT